MLDEFFDKRAVVLSRLGELSELAQSLGAQSVAKRVQSQNIGKLKANRFHLVVVGEFNHGKTTFVNALLGEPVLPVGVTPTTAVIHEIEYGETPQASVLYDLGESKEIAFEHVRDFALGSSAEAKSPEESVRVLRVQYPAALLRQQIALVDTPGVNDLSLQRADITYNYIPQSDAVLFLLDAGQLVKESERVFLQEKLLGQSRDKIVFVVTKKDILSSEEQEQALRYVREQLSKLVSSPQVFAISALAALEGRREESGMDELLSYLTHFLATERGRILLDNSLGEALQSCSLLGKGIDAKRRGLEMSAEEVARRIQTIETDLQGHAKTLAQRRAWVGQEIAAIRTWAQRDLERFADDVCAQIPGVVDGAQVDELKAHLGPFLETTLRDWAQAETREIADALEALAEKTIALVREDARDAGRRLASVLGTELRTPAIEVDTFAYDVGVAALATVGLGALFAGSLLGGVLMVAAPVLAFYMHSRVQDETRRRAKELAPVAVREAASKIGPKLREMIESFGAQLDAWVVSAGEDVYREVIEVLAAAQQERSRGEAARALAITACQQHNDALSRLEQHFSELRQQLWTPAATE